MAPKGFEATPSSVKPKRTTILALTTLVLGLMSAEVVVHGAYWLIAGHWLWSPIDLFRIRECTQVVADARCVTMKRGYTNDQYPFGPAARRLSTDVFGFRLGHSRVNTQGNNILFLGDSVPFGWGVDDEETVPSHLALRFREIGTRALGVINAGVPSYTLKQALERYRVEIAGRFAVNTVILQVYDPANQFAFLGRNWTPDINHSRPTPRLANLGRHKRAWEYSAFYQIVSRYIDILSASDSQDAILRDLDVTDTQAFDAFRSSNMGLLEDLLHTIRANGGGRLLLIPVNVPSTTEPNLPEQVRAAIDALNDALRVFAQAHPHEVAFLDVRTHFRKAEHPEDLFVDACCHLSGSGSRLQARLIAEALSGSPTLVPRGNF